MRRSIVIFLGLSIVVSPTALLTGQVSAATSGTIGIWITPDITGKGGGKVLVTGAIADYGTARNATSTGGRTDNQNATYKVLLLKGGTILVNATQLNQAANKAQPTINTSNCSLSISVSAPVQFVSGTGTYSRITGTANLTATFAGITPKKSDGSCNQNANPKPGAAFASISGTGTVS